MPDKNKRLLVLDDDPDVGDILVKAAAEVGFVGSVLTDPSSLMPELDKSEPDVLAIDLRLPGIDGVQLLRALGERKLKAQVLVVSGLDQRTVATAERVGAAHGLRMLGWLHKPFKLSSVRELLSRGKSGDRPEIVENDIANGIEAGQFFLVFQPKVTLDGGVLRIAGAEALARWRHPTHGTVSPMEFIPVVERSKLLLPFTLQVLRQAAQQRRAWSQAGYDVTIAVNISAALIGELNVPELFAQAVAEEGCTPGDIILEVTETGVMTDAKRSMEVLARLRVKGFGLSIDDFGTGYSSLVQLYRMPFNELKVDRSFVAELCVSDEAAAIVRSTIDLSHHLRLKVCAEGVEDKATHDQLIAAGCDIAQGYFYGKPLEAKLGPPAVAKS